MSKEFLHHYKIPAFALALALGGCGLAPANKANEPVTPENTPLSDSCMSAVMLTGIRLIGPAKDGGYNAAIGADTCAPIRGANGTHGDHSYGEIVGATAFEVYCVDTNKVPSVAIDPGYQEFVDVESSAATALAASGVKECPPYQPTQR